MRTLSMIVLSAIMFVFHILLAPAIEIFNAKIDFIMISVVMLAIFSEKWYPPVFCGLYSGLSVDILTQGNTYINTCMYAVFAVLAVVAVAIIPLKKLWGSVISTTVAVALKHLFFVFLLYVMRLSETLTIGTFIYGLPSVLYTAVVSAGLYFAYKTLFDFQFMKEKSDDDKKIFV